MSQVVAFELMRHRPQLVAESVHTWQNGAYEGKADAALLRAASAENYTLVTYDLKTIPQVLIDLQSAGESHSRVIFVDNTTVSSSDFGQQVRSLTHFWERYSDLDWENRVSFLDRTPMNAI